ncbi:MAG: patatin-like phospholipase family protein [Spirochaetales bacterium]|nr:patatin-like phospholipase family protein [Spirochaetales bacterium]
MDNVLKKFGLKRNTVGLALGSGGARGLAHIGVLKCLIDNNIPIDYISGASIGAWIGAMYALDTDLYKIAETIEETRKKGLSLMFDPSLKGGFVKGEKISEVIKESLRGSYFEETVIPLRIISTELVSGKEICFSSGLIEKAVRASISVPSIFLPYKMGEMLLVDGGVSNPVPVSTVKEMGADIVIAVNLDNFRRDGLFDKEDSESVTKVTQRSIKLLRHYLAEKCSQAADFIIEPKNSHDDLSKWRNLIFKDGIAEQNIELGYIAAMEILPQIKERLKM